MVPQQIKKAITDNPKKLANLIDLVNLPSTLREFVGQSQISRLGCFMRVWSYIKTNNLQDPNNKNVVNCDEKLKSILLGKPQVDLAELPALIRLHFPKEPKVIEQLAIGHVMIGNVEKYLPKELGF
ncbi:upstream activation factor subunit UAF30-like [Hevea brasiliensis]|nr:upstream activation factor subunit UAF30-like [Hevea brasiliensis]